MPRRAFLAWEADEEAIQILSLEGTPIKKTKSDDRLSLPSCTSEGRNYILECITCRKEDRKKVCLGETSRNTFQRGREHAKEIQEATVTHPMVIHMIEEHRGEIQPALMRSLTAHLMAMNRQIQESLNIIEETKKVGLCLNLRSEWAGAKIPGL